MAAPESSPQGLTRRPSRSAATTTFSTEVFDNEVVPSAIAPIAPLLLVANEVEPERPRVAHLCRFYAFEKAHRLDPGSSGRGVRQFKTLLLQRLERENASSLSARVKKSDAREITSFYQQYYEHYVKAVQEEQVDRAQVSKAYNTLSQLFEVLCGVNKSENKSEKVEEVVPEIIAAARDVQEKTEIKLEVSFDKEIKLGFDGFDATQYIDDKAAMTYQEFREQFLSYNYCTEEASRCRSGDEESRPSCSIPPWTLIVPKLEENSSLLQLPHDNQVVGVRLPADIDSVSASTAAMLLQKFGSTMEFLKRKLRKDVAGYNDDEDEMDDEEENCCKQQVKEGGEQREENNKHIKSLHEENVDNLVIVLSDDEGEKKDVKEQIDDLQRHGGDDEVVEESGEDGEELEEEKEDSSDEESVRFAFVAGKEAQKH